MRAITFPSKGVLGIVCLITFLSAAPVAYSQRVIELNNPHNEQVKVIRVGTRVAYRLVGEPSSRLHKGRLEAIAEDGIWVSDRFIPIDSLHSIGQRTAVTKLLVGVGSVIVGAALVFNINGGHDFGTTQYITGQALAGTGLIQTVMQSVRLFNRKQHNVTDGWKLQTEQFHNHYEGSEITKASPIAR